MAKETQSSLSGRALGTLAALAFLAHAGSLGAGFVFDDRGAIVENPVVNDAFDIGSFFRTDFWGQPPGAGPGTWRPLVVLSFWINKHIIGGGYHETNLLVHVGAVLALSLALFRQTKNAVFAIATSAVFAVLGSHTEAVVGLVGRADVMAAGLGFLAWYLMGRADEPEPERRALSAFAAFVGAMLCKESAIVLPAIVLFADILLAPRAEKLSLAPTRYGPLLAAAGLAMMLRYWSFGSPFDVQRELQANPLLAEGLGTRVWTSFELFGMALRRIVLPIHLSADYSYAAILPAQSPLSAGVLVGLGAFVAIALTGVRLSRKEPLLSLAVVLLVVPWLVASQLVFRLPTIFAERLLYAPATGFAASVGWAAARLVGARKEESGRSQKKRAARSGAISPEAWKKVALLVGPLLVVNVWLAMERAKVWRDDRSLFEAALAVTPGSARVQHNYGSALLNEGKSSLAIPYFERAIAILPSWSEPHAQLGVALLDERRPIEAEEHFRKAVALEPDNAKAVFNMAVFLLRQGKLMDAKRVLEPFVKKFPMRGREAALLKQVEEGLAEGAAH